MNNINTYIFRDYDIRGIYPNDFKDNIPYLIGSAFGTYLKKFLNKKHPSVAIGRDNRPSGKILLKKLIKGLHKTGCKITYIGQVPTPLLYFATVFGSFDGSCQITASHNPKEYNGFKFQTKNAVPVFGKDIKVLLKIILENKFAFIKNPNFQKIKKNNFYKTYFNVFKNRFSFSCIKAVIDCGNGISSNFYPKILKSLGIKIKEIFTKSDGTFPNHEPDPSNEKNLKDLKKKVLKDSADIGIAFDGDGDRAGFIDEKGNMVSSDHIFILLSRYFGKIKKNFKAVCTVAMSDLCQSEIERVSGKSFMVPVGHSYVQEGMNKNKAVLGGEQSGHFYINEHYYPYDDALMAAIYITKILENEKKTLSDIIKTIPKTYCYPEMRPYCSDKIKFNIIKRIKKHFVTKYSCNTIDGVRISFGKNSWAGIRASNTSPRISIIMEAKSKKTLERIKKIVFNHLKKYKEIDWNK